MTIKEGIAYDINTAPEHIDLKAEDMMATFNIGKTALWRWVKQKILPPPYEYISEAAHWTFGQMRDCCFFSTKCPPHKESKGTTTKQIRRRFPVGQFVGQP